MRKIYRLFALACVGAVVLAACSNKSKSEAIAEGGAACADAPAAFVEAEGVRLHYAERGDGPPVIMIHGASSNLCDLDLALGEDAAAFRRVILFDRPGLGRSGR
ncbi:MAG: alpha/beta hydrolase, partial [Pseudomonadota bacterium]